MYSTYTVINQKGSTTVIAKPSASTKNFEDLSF